MGARRRRRRRRRRSRRSTCPGTASPPSPPCPSCADPDDTSGAVSVQSFVDNVLDPGGAGDAAVRRGRRSASLADLFPSPWLHLGGDEVPDGAWSGSPAAEALRRRARTRRRRTTSPPSFVADLVELRQVDDGPAGRRVAGGRRVGALRTRRRLRRRLEVGGRLPAARRRRVPCRRLAGRGVLPRHGRRRRLALARGRAGPGTRRSPTSRRFDVAAGWSAAERRTCSASRRACGPSTSATGRRWNGSCSRGWRPSPDRRGA